LWGDWVNVRYGDQEGYVFDAYLSRLPAIGVEYKNFSPAPGGKLPQCEPVSDFLKRHFLVVDTLTSARECSKNCATPKFRN
ncbi:MAG: hypothetical protein JNK89_06105, partial [Saprospiraceae bacterium]|nr:hypothetical protein [Saprospiraceae bacterium]